MKELDFGDNFVWAFSSPNGSDVEIPREVLLKLVDDPIFLLGRADGMKIGHTVTMNQIECAVTSFRKRTGAK